jgi:uncharacterized protein YndB with AHSA1/START domain
MDLKFQVQARIEKPISEVFDAVYNPRKLEKYFTTQSASAPLDPGTTVVWQFADYPGEIPVQVGEVVPNKLITFTWEAQEGGYSTKVEMQFEMFGENETLVKIAESGWQETPQGLKSSYGNCHGWTQMSCCLKVFLEHGINLREGFYSTLLRHTAV